VVPVFLISLKAGGVGLNLTAADTVIHYDPWWNPAVEEQATDRAHRIGQTKKVFVYKLIAAGTIEQRMLELQERKRNLSKSIMDETGTQNMAFSEQDLEYLLSPIG
jgi:SNF2 family DNA or RNA helicase